MIRRVILISLPLLAFPLSAAAQVPSQAPLTPPCVTIPMDLSRGSTDAATGGSVSLLQDFLASVGDFHVQATGYFGPLTEAGVESFQAANGIRTTGYVGPLTRAAIRSVSCAEQGSVQPPAPVPGSCPAGYVCTPIAALPRAPIDPAAIAPVSVPAVNPINPVFAPPSSSTSTLVSCTGSACSVDLSSGSVSIPASLCPNGLCTIPPQFNIGQLPTQIPASTCPAGHTCSIPAQ